MKDLSGLSLDIGTLQSGYRSGAFSPVEVVHEVYRRIRAVESNPIWIYLIPEEVAAAAAGALPEPTNQTLFGIPFAVKDNIDNASPPNDRCLSTFLPLHRKRECRGRATTSERGRHSNW